MLWFSFQFHGSHGSYKYWFFWKAYGHPDDTEVNILLGAANLPEPFFQFVGQLHNWLRLTGHLSKLSQLPGVQNYLSLQLDHPTRKSSVNCKNFQLSVSVARRTAGFHPETNTCTLKQRALKEFAYLSRGDDFQWASQGELLGSVLNQIYAHWNRELKKSQHLFPEGMISSAGIIVSFFHFAAHIYCRLFHLVHLEFVKFIGR